MFPAEEFDRRLRRVTEKQDGTTKGREASNGVAGVNMQPEGRNVTSVKGNGPIRTRKASLLAERFLFSRIEWLQKSRSCSRPRSVREASALRRPEDWGYSFKFRNTIGGKRQEASPADPESAGAFEVESHGPIGPKRAP